MSEIETESPQAPSETIMGGIVPAQGLERLADTLHTVKRLCPTLPVLAIRWMHVRHPLNPMHEALMRGEERVGWTTLARRFMQGILSMISLTAQLIRLRWCLRRELAAIERQRFAIVTKSCAYGPNRLAGDQDFYVGDLQQRLDARGVKTLLLCSDVSQGRDWPAFARGQTTRAPFARLPELALVPPSAPLIVWGRQLLACARLRRLARRLEDPMTRRAARLASQDCLAPDTAVTALSYWVGRGATRRWRPRAWLSLYEGHAWEPCLRLGVRHEDASCRLVGYQHTVVFPESLALHHPTSEGGAKTIPDVVLASGSVPIELMRPRHEPYATRFVRFGSFRYRAHHALQPRRPDQRTILVTPEGYASEVKVLFRFAVECAKRLPRHTVILRCHPEVPMGQSLRLLPGLLELPNIVRSEGRPIEEDFARASVLLYRGSSAALYAVLHGLRPIYYDAPGTGNRDPLYGIPAWRWTCATVEECLAGIEHDAAQPGEARAAEWGAATEYVRGCTGPVGDEQLDEFLDTVGLAG